MSSTVRAPAPPAVRVPLWVVSAVLWSSVLALVAIHAANLGNSSAMGTIGVVFTSIVVEALPFILVGAVVSAAIATFVPDSAFARLAELPRSLQVPGAALAGIALPVCECGSVPVGKRLLARGIEPAAGVAFMLAAPILNPVVLISTWVAYQPRGLGLEMTVARSSMGLVLAVVVGLAVARFLPGDLVRADARQEPHDAGSHDHGSRGGAFAGHVAGDFVFMGRFLVLGAAISAVIQTVLPESILSGIGGAEVVAILTMILLAFALSLCSEADAFVAVSFTAFPLSAQLAFLTMGPALDAKLAVLYGATFRRGFIPILLAAGLPLTVGGSLLFGALT